MIRPKETFTAAALDNRFMGEPSSKAKAVKAKEDQSFQMIFSKFSLFLKKIKFLHCLVT